MQGNINDEDDSDEENDDESEEGDETDGSHIRDDRESISAMMRRRGVTRSARMPRRHTVG